MDLNQMSQMINWLDEEHRRDKALLLELRQKVESQAVELENQARRIQDLEGRLSNTQAKLSRFTQIEQALQQLRDEVTDMIARLEEENEQARREEARIRQVERENTTRAINELRRSLDKLPQLEERIKVLREEDKRIIEQVQDLATRTTTLQRTLPSLEDRVAYVETQRVNDQKHITQLQEENVQLLRRTEAHQAKLELIEDLARRNEQAIAALQATREDLRRDFNKWVENAQLREADFQQKVQQWEIHMNEYAEQIRQQQQLLSQTQQFQVRVQEHLKAIEAFKDELEREFNLTAEKMRLSVEQQRRLYEEWTAEQEQRWQKFRLEREAKWNQIDARHEELKDRLRQLETFRREANDRLQQLGRQIIDIQTEYRALITELWAFQEEIASAQLEDMRRHFQRISDAVREHTNKA